MPFISIVKDFWTTFMVVWSMNEMWCQNFNIYQNEISATSPKINIIIGIKGSKLSWESKIWISYHLVLYVQCKCCIFIFWLQKLNRKGLFIIIFNYHVNALELKLVWHPQNSLDTHTGPKTPWVVDIFSNEKYQLLQGNTTSQIINDQLSTVPSRCRQWL